MDPGAVWEDFKVGFAHLARWDRVVVVGHMDWIRLAIPMLLGLVLRTSSGLGDTLPDVKRILPGWISDAVGEKNVIDTGLSTNKLGAMIRFWQEDGVAYFDRGQPLLMRGCAIKNGRLQ